jgi:nitrate/TMAO reductase-like tetraheme cytochrome c subunit
MRLGERLVLWSRVAFYFGNNWISLLGAVLTTSAGLTLVGFWAFEMLSHRPVHPYAGIVLFLVLPGVFLAGLVLMPIGALWRRARLRRGGAAAPGEYPRIDLKEPHVRHGLTFAAAASVVNVVMLGTATFKGVEYMDSNQFCGVTCHKVMEPEYTAFLDSPHSRVGCVQCHIGPGASWFVKSKLSGVRQVFAVALETYSRPIPSPVHDLRPARETCEQCHWPAKFHGDKFLVRTKFTPDEQNTPTTTVLVLKVGGRGARGSVGIHGRHLDDVERVSYVTTDPRRQVIPRVSYRDDDGKTVEYVSEDVKPSPEELARAENRKMDCIDCHNQPSHAFELPERAVDRAMGEGRISRSLPFAKKLAVELLRGEYASRDEAARRITEAWAAFYRDQHAAVYREHRAVVEHSGAAVKAIYLRNVFPDMKVTWGTHPNHIGHEDFLGCFRCHDDSHKAADGRTISQDCEACHTILAQDETNPKVLADLGLQP